MILALLFSVIVSAFLLLPLDSALYVVTTVAVGCFVSSLLAPRMPFAGIRGLEVVLISFAVLAVILIPMATSDGTNRAASSIVAAGGAQACVLFWCALRWEPPAPRYRRGRVEFGEVVTMGLFAAAFFSVIATFAILPRIVSDWDLHRGLLWTYPAYVVGCVAAATLFWILQGLRHSATGLYVIGTACGCCCYFAVMPIVAAFREVTLDSPLLWITGYTAGAIVGPAVSLSWDAT